MPKDQPRIKMPLQPANHKQTAIPSVMIPCQATMRMTQLIILRNMELIRRPDKRAILLEIDLHDAQSWRMTRGMVDRDTLVKVQVRIWESVPV